MAFAKSCVVNRFGKPGKEQLPGATMMPLRSLPIRLRQTRCRPKMMCTSSARVDH